MIKLRYVVRAATVAAVLSLVASPALAQDVLDEDSLLAQEELTLTDAVEGELPAADGSADDFLSELFGDSEPVAPEALGADEGAAPLTDLFAPDAAPSAEAEVVPESLDAVVDGIKAEPAADIDAFPLDAGFDADAVLGEMLEMGDSEAVAELNAGDESGEVPEVEPVADADLDAMLGEMVADEPDASVATSDAGPAAEAAPADDLGFLFDDAPAPAPADTVVAEGVEEKGAPAVEDDLGFLFGEEPAAAVMEEPVAAAPAAEIASPAAAEDDLGFLFDEAPAAAAADEQALMDEAPTAADPDDLDSLIGELALEAETTPVAPVAEPEPAPAADPMALNEDIFKSLADEAKADMKKAPTDFKAPEVVIDPFADALSLPADPVAASVAAPTAGLPADAAPDAQDAPFALDAFVAAESADMESQIEPAPVMEAPNRDLPEGAVAFEEAERLKRVAREYHAISTLETAKVALRERDYPRAISLYEQALSYLPRRADLEPVRAEARKGLGAAYYLQALSQERMEDYEKALIAAQKAVQYGYVRSEDTVARIQRKIDQPPAPEPQPPKRRWREDDYLRTEAQVKEWLKRGREAYLTGEYEKAILAFESVLARDPENKEAIRLMHSAADKQYDRSSMELNATGARMMATVRDTWNPRQYGLHETPLDTELGTTSISSGEDEKRRAEILDKMSKIRIPEVDFRQANIRDVVKFLFEQSVEFDPAPNPADRKGVNIILKLDQDASAGPATGAAPAGDFFAAPATSAPGAANETLVTFSALDITLKEALDYSVDIAGLKYLIRGNAVMVMPKDAAIGDIEHRMYDVLPSAISRLQELSSAVTSGSGNRMRGGSDFITIEGSGGGGGEEVDLKGFFTEMGVEWPSKSSIKFVRGLGKLVVANTLENLTVFEKVLSILNVVPYQIEIEARFIEVAQTDVDSLGLEWLLNDNWEIARKKNPGGLPLASQQRIQMNANGGTGGFTAGNRFLSSAGVGVSGTQMTDAIASLSGVLTNPELTVVLHALQQKGNTDLLSAPKITTQSGQAATIKVVTEYIYPTEFETSGIGGDNNNTTGTTGGGVVGAVVTPRDFQTREVGVILEVTPEVSPEGQMINLSLSPEVVSEPTWRNYGSSYTSFDPNGNPITQELNMEQPFFHTRKLTTNLLIYNGATVVMGGMITEVRNTVDDRIPLLGDIPLIGRLFRSKYESSEKRNLLIFVTARLVDPSGRALDRERFGVDKRIAEKLAVGDSNAN